MTKDELKATLSPQDMLILKTLESFSTRWSIMLPILNECLGQRRMAGDTTKAQAKLTKMYFRSFAKSLGGKLKEEETDALAAEIATADAALLADFLGNDYFTIDQARLVLQAKITPLPVPAVETGEEFQAPGFSPGQAVQSAEGVSPIRKEMEEASVANTEGNDHAAEGMPDVILDETCLLENFEPIDATESALMDFLGVVLPGTLTDDELWKIGASLALERIESLKPFIGRPMVNQELIEHLKDIDPRMNKENAERLVAVLKEKAGNLFTEEVDDDIPF